MGINSDINLHHIVICANMFVKKDGKYLMIKRSAHKEVLPNHLHPVGGKIDQDEDPLMAAKRELMEEAGIEVDNVKLEAVVTEVLAKDDPKYRNTWMIFHFSGDYKAGNLKQTEEGELLWVSKEELLNSDMFISVKRIINHIINPNEGPIFVRFVYDKERNIIDQHLTVTPI